MTRRYSLSYLTGADLPPPELASVAAELGYATIGVRMLPAAKGGPYWPLLDDAALLRATRERLAATGVSVLDVEILWLTPEFDVGAAMPLLEASAALGARALLVGGADNDIGRMTASYAAVCAAGRPLGITMDLEYMPWTTVPDATTAAKIVADAGEANGGVLVDALHFMRSAGTVAEIAGMPRKWLHYAQICDAPFDPPATMDGMIHAARMERQLPGEGGIPLKALFDALPHDIPVSVEVPHAKIVAEVGSREWARRALAASRRVLEEPDGAA